MTRICPYVSVVNNSKIHLYNYSFPAVDETIDYTKIDFEARRVKARRAHEEIISGRYRQPNLAPRKLSCYGKLNQGQSQLLPFPVQVHGWSTRAVAVATSWADHYARVRPPLPRVAAAAVAATRAARYHCQNQRRRDDAQRMR